MPALVRTAAGVALEIVPCPRVHGPDDVLIAVARAGICRTDLYAADGRLPVAERRVLGHEFSGTVLQVGGRVDHVQTGDRVAVMPALPCGTCALCRAGAALHCPEYRLLGLDVDGAFASVVSVPAPAVYRLPNHLAFGVGAYAEPVAAALGVLDAGLSPQAHGLVFGRGRLAELVAAVLREHGFADVTLGEGGGPEVFDFVVETGVTAATWSTLVSSVRPGGTIVLKSRSPEPVPLDLGAAVRQRLRLVAVNYGSFSHAMALLAQGRLPVDDLLGETHALSDFADVFELARGNEARKLFFTLESP